ncbi:hypothetical protein Ccrd_008806 [Cynara cardunculus var. scolymus]|uniref:Uncharacterized protein n=1 Tax=Cynara cardunculus var. scolymus TaxID=59895 RepID=A0A103XEE3_CYNCS|nr:hypothetical protein Ccrd_008806 [Cynara cardunculus var. scolymus]
MAPVATFMLSLVARAVVPFDYGPLYSFNISQLVSRPLANSITFGEKRQVPLDKQITFGITFKDPLTVTKRHKVRLTVVLNSDGYSFKSSGSTTRPSTRWKVVCISLIVESYFSPVRAKQSSSSNSNYINNLDC